MQPAAAARRQRGETGEILRNVACARTGPVSGSAEAVWVRVRGGRRREAGRGHHIPPISGRTFFCSAMGSVGGNTAKKAGVSPARPEQVDVVKPRPLSTSQDVAEKWLSLTTVRASAQPALPPLIRPLTASLRRPMTGSRRSTARPGQLPPTPAPDRLVDLEARQIPPSRGQRVRTRGAVHIPLLALRQGHRSAASMASIELAARVQDFMPCRAESPPSARNEEDRAPLKQKCDTISYKQSICSQFL